MLGLFWCFSPNLDNGNQFPSAVPRIINRGVGESVVLGNPPLKYWQTATVTRQADGVSPVVGIRRQSKEAVYPAGHDVYWSNSVGLSRGAKP